LATDKIAQPLFSSSALQPRFSTTARAHYTNAHKKEKFPSFEKAGMSPLLGVYRPLIKKRSGRLPISKGFTLLSVSHEGKGNATPWVSWVRVVAAQLAF
jgi:hypothetical protein